MTDYGAKGYLTPDTVPDERHCRIFRIPDSTQWLSIFMGALWVLAYEESWQKYGDLTAIEAADAAQGVIWDAYNNNYCSLDVPAPFWDDGTDVDAVAAPDDQPWYGELVAAPMGFALLSEDDELTFKENLSIWLVAGFIALAGQPGAAIAFIPFGRRFTLAFKSGSAGAIVRVLFEGLHLADIDTYGVEDQIIEQEITLPDEMSFSVGALWVEHSGEHNPDATPNADGDYTISVVRKRLDSAMAFQLRQNPDNSCQLEQSTDGETWTLAFDYSLCIPPAQQTILDTVINNNTWVSSFAPTVNFISQAGYTDEETANGYAALCYAAQATVEALFQICYKAKQNEITAETVTAVALGIAAAVLDAFNIVTFGALTPLALAITSAALGLIAYIEAQDAGIWLELDNKAAMVCLMISNLQAKGVSLANFQTAFDGGDCLSSQLQAIADILSRILRFPATASPMYTNFVNALGNANAVAQSVGFANTCVCDVEVWQYVWDFNSGDIAGWYIDDAFQRNPPQTTIYDSTTPGYQGYRNQTDAYYTLCPSNPDVGAVGAAVAYRLYVPPGCEVSEVIFYGYNNRYMTIRVDDGDCDEGAGIAGWHAITPITEGWHKIGFQLTSNNGAAGFTTLTGVGIGGSGANPLAPCDVTPVPPTNT